MIMGATASMLWWPDSLCEALAASGRFVIRYDNRDTGRSTTGAPGRPTYSTDDLADDALHILDAYSLPQAHLVGMSLGGMIAQLIALKAPDRVRTLTLISTSAFDEADPDLPPMDPAFLAHFAAIDTLDWSDRAAVIAFQTESFRLAAGVDEIFDAEAARDLAAQEFDRAINIRSALNHGALGGGEAWAGRLDQITAPALVIHGRRDSILSFAHGRRLADKLGAVRMVALDGGHELNAVDQPVIVREILAHTA
ncbi:MAG: alpha/beta hydrolase [Brevundimonas sp.]|nr:MAG: alpha/beta hydrolase [Brevundimonas sp.]